MNFLSQLFKEDYCHENFFLLAGPCVVENRDVLFRTAEELKRITQLLNIPLVFKSSYTKANRSSLNSFTGIGVQEALRLLQEVRTQFELPIVTDIHSETEAPIAAEVADVLQIPAFLCRQTTLLQAAAKTGKVVNVKKGQFLSPEAMKFALEKVVQSGNEQIMLTERGTTFGYQDLVVDFRSIPIMKGFGKPVVMDCTHAVQQPNQTSGITGGTPKMIETMAKCAIVAGADGLFIETHPKPTEALSDGANMLPLDQMDVLLASLVRLKQATI